MLDGMPKFEKEEKKAVSFEGFVPMPFHVNHAFALKNTPFTPTPDTNQGSFVG